jgi:hypothetical protein
LVGIQLTKELTKLAFQGIGSYRRLDAYTLQLQSFKSGSTEYLSKVELLAVMAQNFLRTFGVVHPEVKSTFEMPQRAAEEVFV